MSTERKLLLEALDQATELERVVVKQGQEVLRLEHRVAELQIKLDRAHQATRPADSEQGNGVWMPQQTADVPHDMKPDVRNYCQCPLCGARH